MERQNLAPSLFTISDVLTADECQQMIALAEERGFDTAPIKTFSVDRLDKETRSNDRAIVDDLDLAKRIWSRLEPHVPPMLADWTARGLNERFRFYRCAPGQRLSWRGDGTYAAADGVSLLTLMIYLNDGYEGGLTQFESASLIGKRGMALLFEHRNSPEGAQVTSGVKYVLRSEVRYGPSARETLTETLNTLTSRWQYYADFYRRLIEASGWRQEAMLAFVERIAPLAIAENIWPGTSHQILHLMKRYDWRWHPPAVSLQYGCICRYRERNTDRCRYKFRCRNGCRRLDYYFLIHWRGKSGNLVSTETVEDIDSALWQRIVAWLETPEPPAA